MQYETVLSVYNGTIGPVPTTIMLTAWTTAHRIEELMTLELAAQDERTTQFALLSMTRLLEPVTPTRLASEMGLAPATLSDRLRELFDLGHVQRQPNPHDGRSYVISTTAAGRRVLDRAQPAVRRAYDALFEELTVGFREIEASIDELNRALDAALEKRRRGRPRRHRYA
jgi:DNA-binding MarR family transcriptional regulator